MAAADMISVLTVNYHSSADVEGLAESLRAHGDGLDLELLVTNNSPSDPVRSGSCCSSSVRSFVVERKATIGLPPLSPANTGSNIRRRSSSAAFGCRTLLKSSFASCRSITKP